MESSGLPGSALSGNQHFHVAEFVVEGLLEFVELVVKRFCDLARIDGQLVDLLRKRAFLLCEAAVLASFCCFAIAATDSKAKSTATLISAADFAVWASEARNFSS